MFKKNNLPKINKNIAGLVKKFKNIEVVIDNKMTTNGIVEVIRDLASLISVSEADIRTYYACGCEAEWGSENFERGCLYKYIITRVIYIITSFKGGVSVNVESLTDTYNRVHYGITINALEEECHDCTALREEVKKMRPDSLLQQAVYSHGLATGFGANLVNAEVAEANLKKLTSLHNKEICCAWKSQQIGGFGCFVQGEVTVASNKDLWSFVARDGSRKFNLNENIEYLIERKEDIDFSVCDHTEFFVIPQKLVGFWAKEWFVRSVAGGRELVEKLRKEGYKVWITAARHK